MTGFHRGVPTQTSSSGGITQTYLGRTSIGGSFLTMDSNRVWYCKQITLAKAGFIASVDAYCQDAGTNQVGGFSGQLFADNAGNPGTLLGVGSNNDNLVLTAATGGHGGPRWLSTPISYWATAGTYWVAVSKYNSAGTIQIAYDPTGGTDVTIQSTGPGFMLNDAGSGFFPITTTTDNFSIRASVLS